MTKPVNGNLEQASMRGGSAKKRERRPFGTCPASLLQLHLLVPVLLLALAGCGSRVTLGTEQEALTDMKGKGPYTLEGLSRAQFTDQAVRDAMSRVPRHKFVPKEVAELAYDDRALPIGFKQTISQPYIVALMTQEAEVRPGAKVLEIGTGSGYQAAVLAELGCTVFSVEIVPELAEQAQRRMQTLGYEHVHVRQGDGWNGWPDQAPFDAILVTASSPGFPPQLLSQLADGGRMIIPVEQPEDEGETLMVVERQGDDFVTKNLGAVKFVPLTGEARIIDELDEDETGGSDNLH